MSAGSRSLAELDKRYLWHPFTQMQQWSEDDPLIIAGGEGNYLIDDKGERYFDGVSSLWVNVHGHGRPEIVAAIREQAGRIAHTTLLGLSSPPAIELAERLAQITPGDLSHTFYSDSGSTAVEIALKMALQYWRNLGQAHKTSIIHLEGSYHGDTLGAVGVGGISLFHEIYGPLVRRGHQVLSPYPRAPLTAEEACQRAVENLTRHLRRHAATTAAIIVEPLVQGAVGMWTHPPGYLRTVADLCARHRVLLIADEVATGFGRTGRMFACEHEDVVPDLLCLAKGITGGTVPLAATVARPHVYNAFLDRAPSERTFYHGHTYTGNPVACAAAVASLRLFESDRVLERLPDLARVFRENLTEHVATSPWVREVRQRGLMVGIELAQKDGRPFPPSEMAGARVARRTRDDKIIIRPLGDTVVLMPPLSSTASELEQLVRAVARAIPLECESR